ncbi:MAG: ResB protein required for cytochrome C biosynthesis [Phycisphaeraceae bacterium]|nr:ResB protein required for cytochrome C biosynthesis [Phycisphaeraceae bacterium]
MKKILKKFASLRITVVVLIAGMMLVFAGTLAQTHMPIREAQKIYFQSFVVPVYLEDGTAIPVLPGGYTLGIIMVLNLLCAYLTTFRWTVKRMGILIMHSGILMLLIGQLFTDLYSVESYVSLDHGQAKNYSESFHKNELVIIDATEDVDKDTQTVYSIPQSKLKTGNMITDPRLPVSFSVKEFIPNAHLARGQNPRPTRGFGQTVIIQPAPPVKGDQQRNLACVYVDVIADGKVLGTWLLSTAFVGPDKFDLPDPAHPEKTRTYQIHLRPKRYMMPMTLKLQEFKHERFTGTNVPMAFSSRLRLVDPIQHEDRELTISMNQPLRYDGKTFYQASFANDDQTTILQVVRNPAAVLPYIACILVTLGMSWHFIAHFLKFFNKFIKQDTEVKA